MAGMGRYLRWILVVPPLLLLALFVGSNRQTVELGLWPTDYVIPMPLALAVLGPAGLGFFVGALLVWFGQFRLKRQLRQAGEKIRLLEDQVQALRAHPPVNPALPPPTA